jgi:methionyl-tRNA formyltransferase
VTVIFFGTSAFGIPALEALLKSRHKLLHVVTTPAKPQGRNLMTLASPIKEWADKNNIPVTETPSLKEARVLKMLVDLNAGAFVVASFGLMLPKNTLDLPKMPLNIHPSLLPKYRGAAPMHWTLLNGDAKTGVCIIRMTEKLDAGDIALKEEFTVPADMDIAALEAELSKIGARLTVDALDRLETGKLALTPQKEEGLSYARKLTKEDGRIDWKENAKAVHNKVRALADWPVAFTFYGGKRVAVLKTRPEASAAADARPGQVLAASAKDGLVVSAGQGAVRIEELQLEGRKKLAAREFLSGFAVSPGSFFE